MKKHLQLFLLFQTIFIITAHSDADANLTISEVEASLSFLTLDLYSSFSGSPVTSYPYSVHIRDTLSIEVSSNSTNEEIKVVIQKCYATPSSSPEDATKYNILKDRCESDNTFSLVENSNKRFRFAMKAFQFFTTDTVYLHCESIICLNTSLASQCDYGCTQARKRRNAGDNDGITNVVLSSSGMLRIHRDNLIEINVLRPEGLSRQEDESPLLSLSVMVFIMVVIVVAIKSLFFSTPILQQQQTSKLYQNY